MIVGFEFFGAGKPVKEPRERWGTGSVYDAEEQMTPTGLEDAEIAWPTTFGDESKSGTPRQEEEPRAPYYQDGRSATVLFNAFHVSPEF